MELIKSVGNLINSASKNFALTLVLAITYCWPLCWLRLQIAGVLLLQSNVSSYLLQKPKRISKSVNGCEKFISVLSYLVIDVQTAKALPHYYFLQFSSWLKNRRFIFNLFLFFFFFFSFFWSYIFELSNQLLLWHWHWEDISLTGMRKTKTYNWKQECRLQITVQVYRTLFA